MKPHTCQHCAFWQRDASLTAERGTCRVAPPQIVLGASDPNEPLYGQFPVMHEDEWCGEWQSMSIAPWDGERQAAE